MGGPAEGNSEQLLSHQDPNNNLYSEKIEKRRQGLITGEYRGATQVKGQYLPNADYKPCCCGQNGTDWSKILGLFTLAYGLMLCMFFALLEIQKAIGSTALWFYFGFYVIFALSLKAMVTTGNIDRARALKEALLEGEEAV
mmetsp:Transcript_18282/g.46437  ORF Transcript_18282/g.46437 Transcript_18282/m.46437 type:complete len:141 (-) Transcript_18282:81-503(-)|eukprot:CAMPEP_0202036504 /NCGR_PEP_ID=MMETSP0962-20130828/1589_1 /ASSEMBLY_ACC=CAM_ASM_000488 /TAXON_ID=4773 /ORGANISM="Schizochytrium aggregatum, Strain ATCC28209" /LENGTH=140 /DNA_ID=CAMNT_0048600583 /DNA_START=91 /DNA_END=513 /DNA_ORIENTATION=-